MYQIGEVAEMVGLSLRTIRYWDDIGLAPPSGHSPGGFRLYTQEDIERIRLSKNMKPLGFSLEEMRNLLEILDQLKAKISDQKRAELLKQLTVFTELAQNSCSQLHEQLVAAEDLVLLMKKETTNYSL